MNTLTMALLAALPLAVIAVGFVIEAIVGKIKSRKQKDETSEKTDKNDQGA